MKAKYIIVGALMIGCLASCTNLNMNYSSVANGTTTEEAKKVYSLKNSEYVEVDINDNVLGRMLYFIDDNHYTKMSKKDYEIAISNNPNLNTYNFILRENVATNDSNPVLFEIYGDYILYSNSTWYKKVAN